MTIAAPSRRRLPVLVALAVLLTILFAACSGGSDSSEDAGSSADVNSADLAESGGDADAAAPRSAAETPAEKKGAAPTDVAQRAVISTATISLRSDDVAQAVFAVQKVVDQYAGDVADEKTEGGDEARRSRLVLRVPSDDFDDAVAALKEIGEVESSTRKVEDVTTQVIDNEVRIRAQERSLRRIELLLDRAESIRDIFAIERELAQRQAGLDSLKAQQAYLADQTSLSTITVHIERTDGPAKKKPDTDDAGFLSGLEAGWKALKTFGNGLATVVGAVLPWSIVPGLLGVPTWLVLRRLQRRRPPQQAAPAAPAGN
jgi:hypothetical protein